MPVQVNKDSLIDEEAFRDSRNYATNKQSICKNQHFTS